MTLRLAVLGLLHESNTFSSALADLAAYRDGGVHSGDAMIRQYATSDSVVGGFLAPGPDEPTSVEVVALPVAMVTPCGPVADDAFDTLVGEMLDDLAAAGPVDGVLVVLHGAAVTPSHPSADAELVARVRAVTGDTPIGAVLDMHANVDPRLVQLVDVLLAYQTNPHVDARRVGARCRALLLDVITSGRRPTTAHVPLPLVVPIVHQDTSLDPMRSILDTAAGIAEELDVLDVSVLEGFPYADVPWMGMSVIASAWDAHAARAAAERLAAHVWQRRQELQGAATPIDDAIRIMTDHTEERPLLVLDVGDNVGGGGPGDSTVLLAAVIEHGVRDVGASILDPRATVSVAATPVGDVATVTVGGWSTDHEGRPLTIRGTVTGHHHGRYEASDIAHGGFKFFDAGAMVGIRTDAGVAIVLTSKPVQPVAPEQYRAVGIEPTALRAILAKGVNGPRAGYASVCGGVLEVDTPGITRNSVEQLHYVHRSRPMFPFEPDAAMPLAR